jgi:hypothetical protein
MSKLQTIKFPFSLAPRHKREVRQSVSSSYWKCLKKCADKHVSEMIMIFV